MNKIKCILCETEISKNNTYLSNHLRRKHNMTLLEYAKKYYDDVGEYNEFERCSFCDDVSRYKIVFDYEYKEFYLDYSKGFFCNSQACKNVISIEYLGEKYNSFKFSKIGSKSEYLAKLHRISIQEAKEMKYNEAPEENKFRCSLEGYIKKYGEEEGAKKYHDRLSKVVKNLDPYAGLNSLESFVNKYGEEEGLKRYNIRCDKIRKSNTINWYIDKYGEEKGTEKWEEYLNKIKINLSRNNTNKKITDFLNKMNIKFLKEKKVICGDKYYFVDFYLPDFNLYIEYFGDYWHCNPSIYEADYYHDYIKMTANEVWIKDEKRINNINITTNNSILILWESTDVDDATLLNIINNLKNKKCIVKL